MDADLEELIEYGDIEEGDEEAVQKQYLKTLIADEKENLKKVLSGNFFKKAEIEKNYQDEQEVERKQKLGRMNEMFQKLEERDGGPLLDSINIGGGKQSEKNINYASLLGLEEEVNSPLGDMKRIAREMKNTLKNNKDKVSSGETFFNDNGFREVMDKVVRVNQQKKPHIGTGMSKSCLGTLQGQQQDLGFSGNGQIMKGFNSSINPPQLVKNVISFNF